MGANYSELIRLKSAVHLALPCSGKRAAAGAAACASEETVHE
jgi:hypothetical protein